MNFFRRIFGRTTRRPSGSRFQRYYGGILHSGVGYPTADEARRDLANYDRTTLPIGWPY